MAQFFRLGGLLSQPAFVDGLVHTEDTVYPDVRTVSLSPLIGTAASGTIVFSAIGAGVSTFTFQGSLPYFPVTGSYTILATDTLATATLKAANAIRMSQVGVLYNIAVPSAGTITLTGKTLTADANILSFAVTAPSTLTSQAFNLATAATGYNVGRFMSYVTPFSAANITSVPLVQPLNSLPSVAGLLPYYPEAALKPNGQMQYLPGAAPLLTRGIVSLNPANNVPVAVGGSVFLSISGANQGRLAGTAIDASYVQINLPGVPVTVRPYSGAWTEQNGLILQKFRVIVEN
jgi:hypothetical protein